MKKKTSLFVSVVILALVSILLGCPKPVNDLPENGSDNSPQDLPDPFAAFKANSVPRWENGVDVQLNAQSDFVFITDKDGSLLGSDKYTTGRIAGDGLSFELLEFSVDVIPKAGVRLGAALHRETGEPIVLHHLEIVKVDNDKLWIVFRETAASPERRVVQ